MLNLAAEKVDPAPAREALRAARALRANEAGASNGNGDGDGGGDGGGDGDGDGARSSHYHELRCADGAPLTDGPGDGSRLLAVLPTAIAMITAAQRGRGGETLPVFLHCQQVGSPWRIPGMGVVVVAAATAAASSSSK